MLRLVPRSNKLARILGEVPHSMGRCAVVYVSFNDSFLTSFCYELDRA